MRENSFSRAHTTRRSLLTLRIGFVAVAGFLAVLPGTGPADTSVSAQLSGDVRLDDVGWNAAGSRSTS